MAWCDHLIANGELIPLEDVMASHGSRPHPVG